MTCTCCHLSAFRYAEYPADSIFASDPTFVKGAHTGKTLSTLQSEAVERYTERTGRNPGTATFPSSKQKSYIEESNHRRARREAA